MKFLCENRRCEWHGPTTELLSARNPFDPDDFTLVCPRCKGLESTVLEACDEPECWRPATCGFPVPEAAYRRTCYEHMVIAQQAMDDKERNK